MLRILVVDDDPEMRVLYRMMLGSTLNAVVDEAGTNAEAIEALKLRPYDLVISDLNRPGGLGTELLQKMRERMNMVRVPFILASGNFTPSIELDVYRRGLTHVIQKPFRHVDLISNARQLLKLPDDRLLEVLRIGKEGIDLDYKASFNIDDVKARASIAKDLIAMANSVGGHVVLGVSEKDSGGFDWTGLPPEMASRLEITKMHDALAPFTGSLDFKVHHFSVHTAKFVILEVFTAPTPIFAKKENAEAKLFCGRIYVRTKAARSEELRDSVEMEKFMQRFIARRLSPHDPINEPPALA